VTGYRPPARDHQAGKAKAKQFEALEECAPILTDAMDRLLHKILRADHGDGCWKAPRTLADELSWSETKVHEQLRKLTALGFIISDPKGRGPGSSVHRRINWSTLRHALMTLRGKTDAGDQGKGADSRTLYAEKGAESRTLRGCEKGHQKGAELPKKGCEISHPNYSSTELRKSNNTHRAREARTSKGNGVCDHEDADATATSTPHNGSAPGFDEFRKRYVSGTGGSWEIAKREFQKRLQEGHSPEQMIAAAAAYTARCEGLGIAGSSEVMWPFAFLADPENFTRDWSGEGDAGQRQAVRWWETTDATDAMARELGMQAYGGEEYPAFRQRIAAELQKRKHR
jgi:hypothetical protein